MRYSAPAPGRADRARTLSLRTLLVAAVLAALVPAAHTPARASNEGFVSASGTRFYLNGKPFFFGGTNCYYLMVYAADPSLRPYVDEVLQESAAMGFSVIRTWAFNDGACQWNALQTSPGVYQEYVFQGLDYVLYRADQLGLRVLLALVNNWDDYGGMNQYVAWAAAGSHDDFYTNSNCKSWYKNHISTVLNRVNTFNGRTYKNDPTVFAWELGNEPRAQTKGLAVLNAWVAEMSAYIKSIDPNHMVAVGIEGFYSTNKNPVSWMRYMGTDFVSTQQPSTVDFAVAHSWPDWWGINQTTTMNFVQQQIADAHTVLKKPFVLEEFGKKRPIETRDDWFQHYLDLIYNNRAAGWLLWILYHDAYQDYDGFGVYYPADSSTVTILSSQAQRMKGLIPQRVVPGVSSMRVLDVGETVYTSQWLPVTATFSGCFYVEDPDRCAGIRVETGQSVTRTDRVRFCGSIQETDVDRFVSALYLDVEPNPDPAVRPLGIRVADLGGSPPAGWPGPTDASGAYNVGLLARTWGRITPGDGFFYLEDGSGSTVKVPQQAPQGTFAAVTGIAGYESGRQRTLKPRDSQDVQVFYTGRAAPARAGPSN